MGEHIGQQFGNYHLIRLLGKGNFAEVYLGEHLYLKRLAAVKLLHTTVDQKQRDSFIAEAQRLLDVAHPHIVPMLDFAVEDDIPFLVMEYASNGSLRTRHPRGAQLTLETILIYVKQAADALQYIHNQKLVHRDIKPENMLLDTQQKLLLSDFGIAAIAHDTGSLHQEGHSGTPPYMAPEQIQGKPRPASDQYALGTVVYEWLSGSFPFHGSISEIIAQQMFAPPPPLRKTFPTLPLAVEEVILKALAKDPKQRFESIEEFALRLEQASQKDLQQYSTEIPEKVHAVALMSDTLSTPDHAPLPTQDRTQLKADKEDVLAEASSPATSTKLIADKLMIPDQSIHLSKATSAQNEAPMPQLIPGLTPAPDIQTDQQRRKRPLPRRALLVGGIALLAGSGAIAYTLLEARNTEIPGTISSQGTKPQTGHTPAARNAPSGTTATPPASRSPSSGSSSEPTSGTTIQGHSTPDTQPASTASSPTQSPPGQPSPRAAGNPNPPPTQAPVAPPLKLQITGIPSQVHNNTDVPVTVTANAEGVEVQLTVTYNLLSDVFNSTSQATSSNGQAVPTWHISLLTTVTGLIAHVTAVAKDQNGQQVKSQPVNVRVLSSLPG